MALYQSWLSETSGRVHPPLIPEQYKGAWLDFTNAGNGCMMKSEDGMDATLERFDRLIMVALEHLDHVRGTGYERYAGKVLESLVCQREKYTYYLSLLN